MNQLTLSDIKPGMIGLSGGGNFLQRCIKFFTRGQFSHSFAIIDGPYHNLSVVETSDTIVKVTPFTYKDAEPDYIMVWNPVAPDDLKAKAALATYLEYDTVWYGYIAYLWFMYRAVARLFGKEPTRMWGWASGGVTCTEVTCHYVNGLFPQLFADKDFNTLAPTELYNLMEANKDLFELVGWYKLPPAGSNLT